MLYLLKVRQNPGFKFLHGHDLAAGMRYTAWDHNRFVHLREHLLLWASVTVATNNKATYSLLGVKLDLFSALSLEFAATAVSLHIHLQRGIGEQTVHYDFQSVRVGTVFAKNCVQGVSYSMLSR